MTIDRHNTGASPTGDATRDYTFTIKHNDVTVVRYFLYDCPVMLGDGESVNVFYLGQLGDGSTTYGYLERLNINPPVHEEPVFDVSEEALHTNDPSD